MVASVKVEKYLKDNLTIALQKAKKEAFKQDLNIDPALL